MVWDHKAPWFKKLNPLTELTLRAKLEFKGYVGEEQHNKRADWTFYRVSGFETPDRDENRNWGVQFYEGCLYLYLWKHRDYRHRRTSGWRKVGREQAKRFWEWIMEGEPDGL